MALVQIRNRKRAVMGTWTSAKANDNGSRRMSETIVIYLTSSISDKHVDNVLTVENRVSPPSGLFTTRFRLPLPPTARESSYRSTGDSVYAPQCPIANRRLRFVPRKSRFFSRSFLVFTVFAAFPNGRRQRIEPDRLSVDRQRSSGVAVGTRGPGPDPVPVLVAQEQLPVPGMRVARVRSSEASDPRLPVRRGARPVLGKRRCRQKLSDPILSVDPPPPRPLVKIEN